MRLSVIWIIAFGLVCEAASGLDGVSVIKQHIGCGLDQIIDGVLKGPSAQNGCIIAFATKHAKLSLPKIRENLTHTVILDCQKLTHLSISDCQPAVDDALKKIEKQYSKRNLLSPFDSHDIAISTEIIKQYLFETIFERKDTYESQDDLEVLIEDLVSYAQQSTFPKDKINPMTRKYLAEKLQSARVRFHGGSK